MRNILWVNSDPDEAPKELFDADVIGLPITIEYTLRCAWNTYKPGAYANTYEFVLKNDPWFLWVIASRDNYLELWNYGMDIIDEHLHRFGSRQASRYNHGSSRQMAALDVLPEFPVIGVTSMPVSVPSAREHYARELKTGHPSLAWSHRERPTWL